MDLKLFLPLDRFSLCSRSDGSVSVDEHASAKRCGLVAVMRHRSARAPWACVSWPSSLDAFDIGLAVPCGHWKKGHSSSIYHGSALRFLCVVGGMRAVCSFFVSARVDHSVATPGELRGGHCSGSRSCAPYNPA